MDIKNHPIWTQVTPYKTKIAPFKKPFHLLRIYSAKQYAKLYPRDTFIAVTGSVGKTTTVSALQAVLSQKYKTEATKPNYDDINCRLLAQNCQGKVYYFGMDAKNCTIWAGNIKVENFQTVFELNLGVERVQIKYKLLGEHQIYAALAAALCAVILKIPLTRIKFALELLEPAMHRFQPLPGPFGSVIIDDTYNSSPQAVEAAIDTLIKLPAKRKIIVLGQMLELGKYSEKLHRQIARKIYKEKIDYTFLGGGDANYIEDELKSLGYWEERVESNLSNSQIVAHLLKTLEKGDVCLIKGSRAVRLDEVVKRVVKK